MDEIISATTQQDYNTCCFETMSTSSADFMAHEVQGTNIDFTNASMIADEIS